MKIRERRKEEIYTQIYRALKLQPMVRSLMASGSGFPWFGIIKQLDDKSKHYQEAISGRKSLKPLPFNHLLYSTNIFFAYAFIGAKYIGIAYIFKVSFRTRQELRIEVIYRRREGRGVSQHSSVAAIRTTGYSHISKKVVLLV